MGTGDGGENQNDVYIIGQMDFSCFFYLMIFEKIY
jgi:hypothetical protein